MQPTARKLRPAVKWHGGKHYLARPIVRLLPPHRTYVEPFAGGLSVLLNKPRSPREVAGDIDPELINFYHVLVERTDELLDSLAGLAYEQATFDRVRASQPGGDLGKAVRFLVVNRWSRGGLGRSFAWSNRNRGGQPGDRNAWQTIQADLPAIADRLASVDIVCCDALQVIRSYDAPDTLFYCDPPYLHSTRTARHAYRHEMDEVDHVNLLATLRQCRGSVVLSSYPSTLYNDTLEGWERFEFDMPKHAGQGRSKKRCTEVVQANLGKTECHLAS